MSPRWTSLAVGAALVAARASTTAPPALAQAPSRQPVPASQLVRSLQNAHQFGLDVDTARHWRVRVQGDAAMQALLDGTLYRLAFREDSATPRYEMAARDSLGSAAPYALIGLAAARATNGDSRQAETLLVKAHRLLQQRGDSTGQAEVLLGRALLVLRVYGVDSARALLARATTLITPSDAWLRAREGCTQLQVEVRAGTRLADSSWQSRVAAARAQGPVLHSNCLFIRAQYLESTGNQGASIALLDTVAELQRSSRQWSALAASLQWQGSALITLGRYREAREKLEASAAAARTIRSVNGQAWALLESGQISRRLGTVGDASNLFGQARPLMVQTGDATGVAYVDRALVELQHVEGNLTTADSLWRLLLPQVDRVAPQIAVAAVMARSDIARRTGHLAESAMLLDSADALILARNMPGWRSEWRYFRGLHELAAGFPSRAIAQWDSLLRPNLRYPPAVRFEVVSRWAEAQAARGQFDAAWRTFRGGAQSLDRWRLSQTSQEQALAAIGDRHFDWDRDLGFATTAAAFARANRPAEALAMAEWRRWRAAQQIALQRGALAIESTPSSGTVVRLVDSSRVDPARLPTLARARLQPSQAVVAYITGRGGEPTTAFVLTRDTLLSVALPPIDSLSASISTFAAFLRAGARPAALTASLSAQLLTPVLRQLPAAVTRLILVPDGDLHRLPFVALHGVTGASVLERYELATAPSVEDALGSAVSVARRAGAASMVIGAPAQMPRNALTGEPWGALPGASAEARRVAQLLGRADLLSGDNVTYEAVMRRLRSGGPVLHVATHAVATPASFVNNGLVLQPSAGHEGFLSLAEWQTQPLPFDLVVLSACASGEGVLLSGQSLHGLVSSALDAGARGVVATRWALDDTAIVPHMVRLYAALQRGDDVVTAVHHVQREAMRAGVSPAIWANLEYVGDPTLRVSITPESSWWARAGHTMRGWLRALGLE